tara:strand:+ start:1229 stop:1714 length:486 start_codon:yes stop_codon:yes gene_type:complete
MNNTFEERAEMANTAEQESEKHFIEKGCVVIPLGFKQMHRRNEEGFSDAWYKIPRFLRNLPDMIVVKKYVTIVEVKGFGDILKLKVEDYKSYVFWSRIFKMLDINFVVNLYCYSNKKHYTIKFSNLQNMWEDNRRETGRYEDNNEEYKKFYIKELEDANGR